MGCSLVIKSFFQNLNRFCTVIFISGSSFVLLLGVMKIVVSDSSITEYFCIELDLFTVLSTLGRPTPDVTRSGER